MTRVGSAESDDTSASGGTNTGTDGPLRLPLVEENLEAHVVEREQGRIRIHKRVETEPVQAQVDLHHDHLVVERVAVDEIVTERREPWYEGNALMVPVYEEVLVTETKLLLKQVIRLENQGRTEQVNLKGTVRREVVDIDEGTR